MIPYDLLGRSKSNRVHRHHMSRLCYTLNLDWWFILPMFFAVWTTAQVALLPLLTRKKVGSPHGGVQSHLKERAITNFSSSLFGRQLASGSQNILPEHINLLGRTRQRSLHLSNWLGILREGTFTVATNI